ncbi:hypothetical protein FE257_012938 [Aspergillus nanangensis]|uniref:Uncharacterized protein n=1 Tax=Aspergillus nanangensis TaxID=2582783 RepID=A0AAD4GQE1_ASPNN|nr:hypothetical protein FE257_012938 [Aspergillus nanangensis]
MDYATRYGSAEMVGLLIQLGGDTDIDTPDDDTGRTPLSWRGRVRQSVDDQFLFKLDGVDLQSKDSVGRAPFANAAREGNLSAVMLLANSAKVAINSPDKWGQTPASLAFEGCGHDEQYMPINWTNLHAVRKFFVECGKVGLDSRDNAG